MNLEGTAFTELLFKLSLLLNNNLHEAMYNIFNIVYNQTTALPWFRLLFINGPQALSLKFLLEWLLVIDFRLLWSLANRIYVE